MMLFAVNLSLECCKSINALMVHIGTFSRSVFSKPSWPVLQELKNRVQ